jgi:hypothetical protein
MKKWLVGLLAAGLCAVSAWAEGVASLPVEESYTATQDWKALTGFSGSGVGTYGDGRCKFDKNGQWLMVQFDGAATSLTFELKGNTASAGTAPASFKVESSSDGENWTELDDIDETQISASEYKSFSYTLASDVRYVRWTYANKYGFNFGLNNVAITSGGPAEFSVTLDKKDGFTLEEGTASSITATAKNGSGDYSYAWTGDLTGDTATLEIPATLAVGPYSVTVTVTDNGGDVDPIEKSISFEVTEKTVVVDYATLPFSYSGPWQKPTTPVNGLTSKGLGTDYTSGGAVGAKFDTTGDWMQIKFEGTPGTLSFGIKGNSLNETNISTFVVQESATGSEDGWTTVATYKTGDKLTGDRTDEEIELTSTSQFVRFLYDEKGAGNVGIYDVAITSGGPAAFSITLDPSGEFKVKQGAEATITAKPHNAAGTVTYVWSADGVPGTADGAVFTIDTSAAGGPYTVTCNANDGSADAAPVNATFTIAEPAQGVEYTLVDDASGFEEGAEYLVVAIARDGTSFQSALKNEASGTRIALEEVEVEDGTTVKTESDAIVWTIAAGKGEGQYTLYNEAAKVYAAAPKSAGNNAQLLTDGTDDLAQWTLDFSAAPQVKILSAVHTDRYLQRNSSAGTTYFAAYASAQATPCLFKKAGVAGFSVKLTPSFTGSTVEQGATATITASAKNPAGSVTFTWNTEGVPGSLNADNTVFTIDTTAEGGPYTVTCGGNDGTTDAKPVSVTFSVAKPAETYTITIGEMEHGTVTPSATEAEAGTKITLTVKPDDGYGLDQLFLNGVALAGTSFDMPAEPVTITATFKAVSDTATLPFVAENTPYSGPWKGATVSGLSSKGIDKDYGDGAAKLNDTGDWVQIKFVGTPGTLSYTIYGNSLSEEKPSTFVVQESSDGETWSALATYKTGDNLTTEKTEASHALASDSQYVRFLYEEKGAGNVGINNVYISGYSEPVPTIVFDGETTIKFGESFNLNFRLENYDGDFEWAVTSGEGSIAPDGLYTWKPTASYPDGTPLSVAAKADGETITTKTVKLVVEAADPDQPIVVCDQGATPTVAVGDTLTLTFTAQNFEEVAMWTGPDEGEFVGEDGSATAQWTWTPSVADTFEFTVSAYDGNYTEYPCTVTVTVTGEGPQPGGEPYIKGIVVDAKAKTVTLTLSEPTGTVRTTDNLMGTWTPYGTPATDGTLVIPITGSPMFFGAP